MPFCRQRFANYFKPTGSQFHPETFLCDFCVKRETKMCQKTQGRTNVDVTDCLVRVNCTGARKRTHSVSHTADRSERVHMQKGERTHAQVASGSLFQITTTCKWDFYRHSAKSRLESLCSLRDQHSTEVQQTRPLLFRRATIAGSVTQIPFGCLSLVLNCSCDANLVICATDLAIGAPHV